MKVLGIRTAPAQLRYALVEIGNLTLFNAGTENLIKVPSGCSEYSEQIAWQKCEIDRIIRKNTDISMVVLKVGEYGSSDTKSNRLGTYFDAIVILAAKDADLPIETKTYNQLGTKRAQVKNDAENRVGKTTTHWNEQIADAIIAAWSVRDRAYK